MVDYDLCERVLNKFIQKYKRKKFVIGICVLGSFVRREMTKHSDIDVYILTEGVDWTELGSKYLNGIHIEYFVNSIEWLKKRILEETGTSRLNVGIFKDAKILYDTSGKVAELIEISQKQAKRVPQKPSRKDNLRFRYLMPETLLDLKDCVVKNNSIGFIILANELIRTSLDYVYKYHGTWMPAPKKIKYDLEKTDAAFAKLLNSYTTSTSLESKYEHIEKLVKYAVNLYGGYLKEYKVRFKR